MKLILIRRMSVLYGILLLCPLLLASCAIETLIFPQFDAEPLEESPAPVGPFSFVQREIFVDDLGDGESGRITLFEPEGVSDQRPAFIWSQGINNQPYYHQRFHEYMASWGYIQVVPDVRPIDFGDERFNARNTEIITRTFDLVADNAEGINADPQRIGVGGYSAGGSHAAFAAGREPRTKALVMWVPAPALVWQGIDPAQELPNVTAPSLFMLAEFDSAAGTWPVEMQGMMGESEQTIYTVAGGIHMYFQQPQFPPCHPGALPRLQAQIPLEEQQFQALTETRRFLDETLGIEREE